jgi:PHD/YefM family antitoxin component YafN of YafNO toxin-antitoxin module
MNLNKKFIPVSIVIPVSIDRRIFECIKSIDVDAEIIVILNNNYDNYILDELRKINIFLKFII